MPRSVVHFLRKLYYQFTALHLVVRERSGNKPTALDKSYWTVGKDSSQASFVMPAHLLIQIFYYLYSLGEVSILKHNQACLNTSLLLSLGEGWAEGGGPLWVWYQPGLQSKL